jgi:hypothetical protein
MEEALYTYDAFKSRADTKWMEEALYTYDAFKSRADAAKAKKIMDWAEANPQMARFCKEIDEMR